MRDPADLFRALADTTRLKMLALLRGHGELCVCDLENALEITQSKASRHLRYLSNTRLLKDRREGVWIYYRIADDLTLAQQAVLNSVPELLNSKELGELETKLRTRMDSKCCGPLKSKPPKELFVTGAS